MQIESLVDASTTFSLLQSINKTCVKNKPVLNNWFTRKVIDSTRPQIFSENVETPFVYIDANADLLL